VRAKFALTLFYLLSPTTATPMNRAFQERGEGGEGRFANFCLVAAESCTVYGQTYSSLFQIS